MLRVLAHAAVSQPHFAIPDKGIKVRAVRKRDRHPPPTSSTRAHASALRSSAGQRSTWLQQQYVPPRLCGGARVQALMQMPSVAQELASLQRHGARLQPLLQLLASSLVAKLPSAPERAAPQLLGLVQAGVLEPVSSVRGFKSFRSMQVRNRNHFGQVCACVRQVAERLAAQLLQQACPEARPDLPTTTLPPEAVPAPVLEAATQLLRALDLRHPEQTDRAVNALLASGLGGAGKPSTRAQQRRDASDDDDEEEGADEEEAEEKQEQEARQRRRAAIFAVLQEVRSEQSRGGVALVLPDIWRAWQSGSGPDIPCTPIPIPAHAHSSVVWQRAACEESD